MSSAGEPRRDGIWPPAPPPATPGRWPGRAVLAGAGLGAAYGLVMRCMLSGVLPTWLSQNDAAGAGLGLMTVAFLFGVPVGVGWLAVARLPSPGWLSSLFLPWVPVLACLAGAALVGWEGSICLLMGAPIMLAGGSVGGLVARSDRLRASRRVNALLVLPLVLAPLEARRSPEGQLREVRAECVIDAPAAIVWRHVVQVREIAPEEQRPALFTALGFPRPLSAVLAREERGGVRHARFEGGLLFEEVVTDLVPDRRLAFTLHARTDLIPPTTLDPHVTIGGPYFDMLDGTYELEPLPGERTRVMLTSRHRLSTRFNLYSGLWSDAIMRSIQRNILAVVEARSERAAAR